MNFRKNARLFFRSRLMLCALVSVAAQGQAEVAGKAEGEIFDDVNLVAPHTRPVQP